ncbi:MAG: fatty acid hydroxylase [Cyanobacteria bacterium RYN_339]|nr:fatty acid hydroxylase [Cyanobacteria bacterium RYN_339]
MGHHLRAFARHGSNTAMAVGLVGMAAWLAGHASWATPAWILAGLLVLPVNEYVFHRFVLHTPPSRIRLVRRFQDVIHYEHHEDLANVARYFTPLWLGIPLVGAFAILYTLLGLPAVPLLVGNLAGYLYYEWVHYMAHAAYVPRTRLGKFQKKYHMWHHHRNEHYWFGVTSPLMDMLAGTYKRLDEVPKSATAHRLYGP